MDTQTQLILMKIRITLGQKNDPVTLLQRPGLSAEGELGLIFLQTFAKDREGLRSLLWVVCLLYMQVELRCHIISAFPGQHSGSGLQ